MYWEVAQQKERAKMGAPWLSVKTPVKCSFLLPRNKGLHMGPCKSPQVPSRGKSLQTKESLPNPEQGHPSYMSRYCCFDPGTMTSQGHRYLLSFCLYFAVEKLRHSQGTVRSWPRSQNRKSKARIQSQKVGFSEPTLVTCKLLCLFE